MLLGSVTYEEIVEEVYDLVSVTIGVPLGITISYGWLPTGQDITELVSGDPRDDAKPLPLPCFGWDGPGRDKIPSQHTPWVVTSGDTNAPIKGSKHTKSRTLLILWQRPYHYGSPTPNPMTHILMFSHLAKLFSVALVFGLAVSHLDAQQPPVKDYTVLTRLDSLTKDPVSGTVANAFYTSLLAGDLAAVTARVPTDLYVDRSESIKAWVSLASSPTVLSLEIENSREVNYNNNVAYLLAARIQTKDGDLQGGGVILNLWFKSGSEWKVIFLDDFKLALDVSK